MKTRIKEQNVNGKYPYLGMWIDPENKDNYYIVLFEDCLRGMVVHDPNDNHGVGTYSKSWSEYLFVRFYGEISLMN